MVVVVRLVSIGTQKGQVTNSMLASDEVRCYRDVP